MSIGPGPGPGGADWGADWGAPSLYGADGAPLAPPEHHVAQWGATTYVGPRRFRPGRHAADGDTSAPAVSAPTIGVSAVSTPAVGAPTDSAPADSAASARQAATSVEPAQPSEGAGTASRSLMTSSRTVAIASLVSRATGFLRSIAITAALGIAVSRVADSYNVANLLPNMVYELLLGGVLSSVVIPLLVNAQEHDPDGGQAYTQRLLSWSAATLGLATLLAVAAAPLLAAAYAQGHAQQQLISIFASLLLPEIFFYGLGALFAAILNTRGIYGPPAWAPVLNNVITIGTVLVFLAVPGPSVLTESSITNTQILVLGVGTTLGIVVQALVLVPFLRRSGFHWQWRFRASTEQTVRLGEIGPLAGWVLAYVLVSQAGLFVLSRVATVYQGGFTTFANADLLFQVPYGIIGVSLLTTLMPRMSRSAARGDRTGVLADLSLGARLSTVGLLPITGGLVVLGPTLTTVLFAYGRSDTSDSRHVGVLLAVGAFGLVPFALVMLQLRVFYACRDARTPTLINVFMILTKVGLVLGAYFAIHGRGVLTALTFATSTSYLVGAVVGHILLTRRFGRLGFGAVRQTFLKVAMATIGSSLVAWAISYGIQSVLGRGLAGSAVSLLVAVLVAAGVLIALLRVVRVAEVEQILAAVRRS